MKNEAIKTNNLAKRQIFYILILFFINCKKSSQNENHFEKPEIKKELIKKTYEWYFQ